jgi:gliding motility-associated lipoprotein GldH
MTSKNLLRKNKLLFVLLLALPLVACDKARVFEENTAVDKAGWEQNKPVNFEVNIDDTLSSYRFFMNVRHAEAYPYSNLYVFMHTRLPDGQMARDTVELMLQDQEGNWTGSGLGDIFDHQIMFRKNLRFPRKGTYQFSLEQAMRTPILPFVMEMGLRIEKEPLAK